MDWSDAARPNPDDLPPLQAADLRESRSAIIASGPVLMRLRSDDRQLWRDVARLYDGYPGRTSDTEDRVVDFTIEFAGIRSYGLFGQRRLAFSINGGQVLSRQPANLGFALLEWGANWCVSQFCHSHLAIHAAVVERNGQALILPGPPGSGKSTLCATMVSRGWRLLTDETAMFRLSDGLLVPVVRPISLKNQAIDIMQARWPDGIFGRRIDDTEKGTVAHLRPTADSIAGMYDPVPARAVIFPTFTKDAEVSFSPFDKAEAFMFLARNSFNYDILGRASYERLLTVIEGCEAAALSFGDADAAAEAIEADWP